MMEYIEVIVSFVVGGGLTTVLTGPSIKARARADAMKSMQDVYQEMISDLRNNKKEMNEDIRALHAKIDEQAATIGVNSNEISRLNGVISHWVCYNDGCVKRNKQRPKKS